MPLQKSIYKVKGKMDGMSYFFSKNGGYQFRSINPNMSELVKNDPRFALTRDYGFAFGLGANFAGALLKTVSTRWRFLVRGNAHADLTKRYNLYFKGAQGLIDGSTYHISTFYPAMRRDYNNLNKSNIPGWMINFFNNETDEDRENHQLRIEQPLQLEQTDVDELKLKGVDCVRVSLFVLRVEMKIQHGVPNGAVNYEGSISSRPILQKIASLEGDAPIELLPSSTPNLDGLIEPDMETCGGIFVLYEPLKRKGASYYTLQRLCNGFWYLPKNRE